MKRGILAIAIAVMLNACAISPQQFAAQRETLRPDELCKGRVSAVKSGDYQFRSDIDDELLRRGLGPSQCPAIIEEASRRAAAAAAIILGGLAVVAIAKSSSSGGGGYPYQPVLQDYDWEWDQFFDQNYQLVWACRGRQTGQFAVLDRCAYKWKNDNTWPSKRADTR